MAHQLYYAVIFIRLRTDFVEYFKLGPDVVLILCSSVVYTTRRFIFGLALLFVHVFFCPFSILITLLGGEGAGLCAYRVFVC